MPEIVTITFNPCIDKSTCVDALLPEKKMRCTPFISEAGGGGINVARAIKKLGGNATAVYAAGGFTGSILQALLTEEKIDSVIIKTDAATRENIIVVDKATNLQYRFITPGDQIKEREWQECLEAAEKITGAKYMIVSGSLQTGIPYNIFEKISFIAKQKNARLILDAPAEALKACMPQDIYLMKPNLNELSVLSGMPELHGDEISDAARQLIDKNICEVVVVSMGAAGALLVTKNKSEQIPAPPVKRKSTVGAGDSMVAGIVLGLSNNKSISEAVRYGVACGTAATLNAGTQLCALKDTEKLYQLMQKI